MIEEVKEEEPPAKSSPPRETEMPKKSIFSPPRSNVLYGELNKFADPNHKKVDSKGSALAQMIANMAFQKT